MCEREACLLACLLCRAGLDWTGLYVLYVLDQIIGLNRLNRTELIDWVALDRRCGALAWTGLDWTEGSSSLVWCSFLSGCHGQLHAWALVGMGSSYFLSVRSSRLRPRGRLRAEKGRARKERKGSGIKSVYVCMCVSSSIYCSQIYLPILSCLSVLYIP